MDNHSTNTPSRSERSNDYRDGKSNHPLTRTITLPENMLPLMEDYAILARQLVEMLERWVAYELELLEHLCADWQQIQSIFLPDQLWQARALERRARAANYSCGRDPN